MSYFSISEPSTVYLKNLDTCKGVEVFKDGLNLPYFFRNLDCKYSEIKFNVKHLGRYKINAGQVAAIVPIEIQELNVTLPTPDRDRLKPFDIVYNPKLTASPARNFTNKGLIEYGTKFKTYPFPIRVFILLHEIGHFFYKNECDADLFAAVHFIRLGYNNSTALYALTRVLNFNSHANNDRVTKLFKHLNK